MPRYLIERDFPDTLPVTTNAAGRQLCDVVASNNIVDGVTWVRSFVAKSGNKTFCIYDGPTPDAIRHVAEVNGLPVTSITQVSVLDPYFFVNEAAGTEADR